MEYFTRALQKYAEFSGRDTGRSGWWQLLGLIPIIGTIVLIVFFVQDSVGDNQYGPNPKILQG